MVTFHPGAVRKNRQAQFDEQEGQRGNLKRNGASSADELVNNPDHGHLQYVGSSPGKEMGKVHAGRLLNCKQTPLNRQDVINRYINASLQAHPLVHFPPRSKPVEMTNE